MKLFKNKKGSQLVEKVLMVAFSVAAGGAVIVYGANVINESKNTNISLDGGATPTNSHGLTFVSGHKYKFSSNLNLRNYWDSLQKDDMEYFSISKAYDLNGNEIKLFGSNNTISCDGFLGYSCWVYDSSSESFYLDDDIESVEPEVLFYPSEETQRRTCEYHGYTFQEKMIDDDYPCLNGYGSYIGGYNPFGETCFEFSGTYVRQGNGPSLLDCLIEVEE